MRNRERAALACVAALMVACRHSAPAPEAEPIPPGPPVAVRGIVMDVRTNVVLRDAGVELLIPGRRAQTAAVTATDARGEFVLDAVPPGKYRLRINHVGFNEFQMSVDVIRPEQGPLTIHLRALDVQCPSSRYHTPDCPL